MSYDGVCIHTVHIGRNTIEYILSIAALSKYMSYDDVMLCVFDLRSIGALEKKDEEGYGIRLLGPPLSIVAPRTLE